MQNEETKERELKGLIRACKNFSLNTGIIVTYEREEELIQDGITIELIPFYKWVLRKK